MRVIFTICSNNYLAQAKVLGISLKEHEPGSKFFIFLCDEKRPEIDYTSLANEIIPIAAIEPQINELAIKYNIIELDALKFYHFSSFCVDAYELPLFHYDRFKLADRPDLQKIHEAYNEELKAAGHAFYQQFKSSYSIIRDAYLGKQKKEKRSLKNRVKRLFAG